MASIIYIKNIWENESKTINVNLKAIAFGQILQFNTDFKKTQEFKNLLAQKYIEIVTEKEYNEYVQNKKESN